MRKYEINSRFVLSAIDKGGCGFKAERQHLVDYIKTGEGEEKVVEIISKASFLTSFQSAIASLLQREFLDEDVQRAYWLGNCLLGDLEKLDSETMYNSLFSSFRERGLYSNYIDEAIDRLPSCPIFHHTFSVVFFRPYQINVRDLNFVNLCMVKGGIFCNICDERSACVETFIVEENKKGDLFLKPVITYLKYNPEIVGVLEEGDFVAIHRGSIVMKIEKNQNQELNYWNSRILGLF